MIHYPHIHQIQRGNQALGDALVGLAGFGNTAGVIVGKNNRVSGLNG